MKTVVSWLVVVVVAFVSMALAHGVAEMSGFGDQFSWVMHLLAAVAGGGMTRLIQTSGINYKPGIA